jgi:hypothetical protein
MARTPDDSSRDEDIKSSIRQMLEDGMDRSEVVKQIASDYNVHETTARRHVRNIEPHVCVSEDSANVLSQRRNAQKSRIVQDIIRLDFAIEKCLESRKFGEMAKLQSAKSTLYKMHSAYHPEIIWDMADAS